MPCNVTTVSYGRGEDKGHAYSADEVHMGERSPCKRDGGSSILPLRHHFMEG
jgi:hypothetical protein